MLQAESRYQEVQSHSPTQHLAPVSGSTVIGLIGPGSVGSLVLDRMSRNGSPKRTLLGIANSTRMTLSSSCLANTGWRNALATSSERSCIDSLARHLANTLADRHILVDTTASPEVAERHAAWLESGLEVVTANKWAAAGPQANWHRLDRPGYRYATTVGAGLPILETLRGLRRAGDRLLSIEGVLSGSLSYLISRIGEGQSFPDTIAEAHRLGLTEPDPRLDLSGVDVARKLVIAARAAGLRIERDAIEVESLVPVGGHEATLNAFLADRHALEAHWQRMVESSPGSGETIVHLGRIEVDDSGKPRARVGLVRVDAGNPFAASSPGDNIVALRTETYRDQPIWIRGPGAGADITALQVWVEVVAGDSSGIPV